MARVIAVVPDLLFGSRIVAALESAGHRVTLVPQLDPGAEADLVLVDLTADANERIELVRERRPAGVPVLAFYAHVEADVRAAAEQAGFDKVVPRSRLAREADSLVAGVLAEQRS